MKKAVTPSKSLNAINVITKVLYVISFIIMALALISIIGGITWCIILLVKKDNPVGEEGYALWFKIILETSKHGGRGTNVYNLALASLNSAIYGIGILIMSNFARIYFKKNINDKTPFTIRGGKELYRLGLIHIIAGLIVLIVCTICFAIFYYTFKDDYRILETEINYVGFGWTGLGIGIIYIIISLFINAANDKKAIN